MESSVTHLFCGPATIQISSTHPQYLKTTPLSLTLQFPDIFLFYFTSRMALFGRYD